MTVGTVVGTLLVAIGLSCLTQPLAAQVSVEVSVAHERADYHFDGPSSYDTVELVPHFFEQHYVLDNVWLEAMVRHRAGVTRVGATPVRQLPATDYDTFNNPGGVVWVSGTTGDARVHSVRLDHAIDLGRTGAVSWSGGYQLQIDRASFLAGHRTDVRNGVLVSEQTVTTAEYTSAQRHNVFFSGLVAHDLGRRWQARLTATAAPASIARLAIELPSKYPGQTLVYTAAGLAALARVELTPRVSRLPVSVHLEGGRAWSYRSTARASQRRLAVGVTVGRPAR